MTSFLYCPNSDPMRACVRTIGTPDWTTVFMNMTKYPGEAFNIPAVVVGENFGRTEQYQILKYFNTSRTLPKALVVQRFHTQYYQRMRKKLWYFLLRILPQYTMVHNLKRVKWLMIMRNHMIILAPLTASEFNNYCKRDAGTLQKQKGNFQPIGLPQLQLQY